jgi:hypothetical protein
MTPASPLDLDAIVLVRLLVRPKSFSVGALAKSIAPLTGLDMPAARRAAEKSLARLTLRACIWPDTKLLPTEGGTSAALATLGVTRLPKHQRADWKWAKKILLMRCLGRGTLGAAGNSDHLAAWIIARKEGLSFKGDPTPSSVLRVLAWRALGSPDRGALSSVGVGAILGLVVPATELEAHRGQTAAPPPDTPPSKERRLTGGEIPPLQEDSLRRFAQRVKQIALTTRQGRWLEHKVFISQIWKDLQRQKTGEDLHIDGFKARLIEASRAGLLLLSRADLVGAMPQQDVLDSRLDDGDRTYHFVETEHLT